MDSMEVNKTIAAVLVAGIVFFLSGFIGDLLVSNSRPHQVAFKIETPAEGPKGGAPAPAATPIAVLLAKADAGRGEDAAKKVGCVACHTFTEGGNNGVGPNLYNIVGEPIGKGKGFSFSSALSGKGGNWSFDALNEWLASPAGFAKGTKMTFLGVKDEQQRADIIAYLRSLSKSPVPLPTPTAAELNPPPAGGKEAAAAPAADQSINALLASADAAAGEAESKKLGCVACHTFNDGGKNGIGPNLYNIVGEPIAQGKGYSFSSALQAHKGNWTYDELNKWLAKPMDYAKGTKMTFMGVPDSKARANIIAYLRSLSPNPQPLPGK
ncbi:MAG: c-type cytochrome [Acetobacteraceae bacterium]|nr:c-type cytochrome [Pseudomonadota bacterium]